MTLRQLPPLALLLLAGCVPAASAGTQTAGTARPAPVPPPAPVRAPLGPIVLDGPVQQGALVLGSAPVGTRTLTLDGKPVLVAPDRRFAVAFDRDAGPQAVLEAVGEGDDRRRLVVPVAPRAWRIERLPTLPRVSQPSAEFQRRRPAELAQIRAARARGVDSDGWRGPFHWPVTGRISGLFGAQRIYRGEPGSYHSGVDVARAEGTPVAAPSDGVVTLAAADAFTLEGHLLLIDHGAGLGSAFLHLSRIDVRVGDRVRRGQVVGAIGATGRATGPHLHWGMTWNGARLDPMLVAGPMPGA